MQIYDEYDDEPEDIFLPVDGTRYSLFYDMEMGGFRDDLPFYRRHLPAAGEILEIACGTGRVGNAIADAGRKVTGIDISLAMLDKARRRQNCRNRYVAMDMRRLAFSKPFDAGNHPLQQPQSAHRSPGHPRLSYADAGNCCGPAASSSSSSSCPDSSSCSRPGRDPFSFRSSTIRRSAG